MSVINKMLRDLDQRQSGASTPALARAARDQGLDITRGTAAISPATRRRTRSGAVWLLLTLSLLVLGAAGWWWLSPRSQSAVASAPPAPVVQAPAPLVAPPAALAGPATASAAVPLAASASGTGKSQVAASASMASRASMPEAVPAKTRLALAGQAGVSMPASSAPASASGKAPPVAAVSAPALAGLSLRLSTEPSGALKPGATETQAQALTPPSALPLLASSAAAVPAVAEARPAAVLGTARVSASQGAQEVLAQAQALTRLGDLTGAAAILREALQRAPASTAVSDRAGLVRDYVRLGLASGSLQDSLAVLEQQQSALAEVADVWALHGHLAQRLGRHTQASAAYLRALALKADEPRWMLGAAVSLAAAGQTGQAGQWAEKARQLGALPVDVANYLRELGVLVQRD